MVRRRDSSEGLTWSYFVLGYADREKDQNHNNNNNNNNTGRNNESEAQYERV